MIDLPEGPALFPDKVTLASERVLIGPRGGGPSPGRGHLESPIDEIYRAIAENLR